MPSEFSFRIVLEKQVLSTLIELFRAWSGTETVHVHEIPPSGSERRYVRLFNDTHRAIGCYGPNKAENQAFLTFTRHFHALGLPVAACFAEHPAGELYLVEDFGDQSLFDLVASERKQGRFPLEAYQKAITALVRFQVEGGNGLDYSVCYPRADFDQQSMMWDLNYFKYYFARLKTRYDEQALEHDFETLTQYLGSADAHYFMYRDFQARNILLSNGEPYFIDYQGGRRGPLAYDLVSLLYQAKASIPQETRDALLAFYLDELSKKITVDRVAFQAYFMGFVLIRSLQTLGAYGFRGWIEQRPHFLQSVPYAVENLAWWLQTARLPIELPEITRVIEQIVSNPELRKMPELVGNKPEHASLTVYVTSFSYKKGIPEDPSGNGGGFAFDCRAIHNPGKYEPYKKLTGRDPEVIQFLREESDVATFLEHCYKLVDMQVEKYLSRGFTNLMVNFGCTGGQHRSVYSADQMDQHLRQKYGVSTVLRHVEQERKGWVN